MKDRQAPPSAQHAQALVERRCVICGGLIAGRGVPVWTQFIGQGDPPLPVRWEEAHVACSLMLEDEDEDEEESTGG